MPFRHALRALLGLSWHILRDRRVRSEWLTRLRYRGRIHQDTSLSWIDRYPRLFAAARDLLIDRPSPTILSFGCAAGEEVITLRRYFPDATLIGAELNRAMLRECHRLDLGPGHHFIESAPGPIAAHGPYNAIFCMAVFTRRPHQVEARDMQDIADFYPFTHFARELTSLADQLAPGGLLVIEHALYLAKDVLDPHAFEAIAGAGDWLAKGPRFAPDGRRITPQPTIARIFRRR